jgi:hypothetical protein
MKLKKIIIVILVFFVASSCEEYLTRDHPTAITDNQFWETQSQVEAALQSCRNLAVGCLTTAAPHYNKLFYEAQTDNAYHNSMWLSSMRAIGNGTVTPDLNQTIRWIWQYRYELIRRCCRVIENIDKAYFSVEQERDYILGEAYVYRAMYHTELLLYYGFIEGIPIVDHTLAGEEIYQERKPVSEVADFIISDLDKAETLLPFKWDEASSDRMSGATAVALKAIVNLNVKRYNDAAIEAKKIIDSGQFELYYSSNETDNSSEKNYRDLFMYVGQVNNERILYSPRGNNAVWRFLGRGVGGSALVNPTQSLVDSYETKQGKTIQELGTDSLALYKKYPNHNNNRDPRLYASIMLPGDSTSFPELNYKYEPFEPGVEQVGGQNASATGYCTKKFADVRDRNSGPLHQGTLDYVIIRYAEILLTYVEALVEKGDYNNPDVVRYLNQIRHRANMPDVDVSVYNTQEKLRELYRRERRVELALEGQRLWDMRRWGIGEQVMDGTLYGAYDPNTGQHVVVESRSYTSPKNDQWPIHVSEINVNPNLKQNIGW